MRYVAGLCFSTDEQDVALIKKNHGPSSLVGRWNAVGGKRRYQDTNSVVFDQTYEDGWEPTNAAMRREFKEETGVDIAIQGWEHFLTLTGVDWEVDFFTAFDDDVHQVRTTSSEVVRLFHLSDMFGLPADLTPVPDLHWIIPMALHHKDAGVMVYTVDEMLRVKP